MSLWALAWVNKLLEVGRGVLEMINKRRHVQWGNISWENYMY